MKDERFEELFRECRTDRANVRQELYDQSLKWEADNTPEPTGYPVEHGDHVAGGYRATEDKPIIKRIPRKDGRVLTPVKSGVDNYGGWR
jgi:hypothetical protein